jgi:hypothetical protein
MKKILMLLLIMTACVTTASAIKFNVDYWLLQAKGGVGFPVLDSANKVNLGFSGGISARRGFDNEMSAGGGLEIINMPYRQSVNAPGPFSATILQLEGVYAPYLPDFIVWPYLKVGLGLWMVKYANLSTTTENPQLSDQSTFGFEFGGGASYPLNNQFSLNVEAMFNQASISGGTGDQYNFITFCAGVTMILK